jgi:hypothetical protein
MTPADLLALRRLPQFPATAADLVRVAGVEAAAALITAWPGQRFPVPKCAEGTAGRGRTNRARLAAIVGEEAATKICRHWGGGELYIPSCALARCAHLHDIIRSEFDGLTQNERLSSCEAVFELGLRHGLSYRMIDHILGQPDSATRAADQLALFS